MKVEIIRDTRSEKRLLVKVQFEKAANFDVEALTWIPKIDELEMVRDVVSAISAFNPSRREAGGS